MKSSNFILAQFMFLLLFVVYISPLKAEESPNVLTAKLDSLISEFKHHNELRDLEVKYLKEQVQSLVQYKNELLSTLYWSLGIAVGFFIVILTASWLLNYKISNTEKDALLRSVRPLVDARIELFWQLEGIKTKGEY